LNDDQFFAAIDREENEEDVSMHYDTVKTRVDYLKRTNPTLARALGSLEAISAFVNAKAVLKGADEKALKAERIGLFGRLLPEKLGGPKMPGPKA
jgi:hypothetical protein